MQTQVSREKGRSRDEGIVWWCEKSVKMESTDWFALGKEMDE